MSMVSEAAALGQLSRPKRMLRRPRDVRALAFLFVAVSIASLAYLVTLLPDRGVDSASKKDPGHATPFSGLESAASGATPASEASPPEPKIDPRLDPAGHERQVRRAEADKLLARSETLMQTKRYDAAMDVINRAGSLAPDYPRSYLHMGRALQGKGDHAAARFFFERAIDLDTQFADAYFGYAEASEELGDLEAAIGGMRSYLHVVDNPDPFRLKVAQARSAIWEWEAKLGRGPWGPTRGIPPGFTAEEIRRDGRGVGIKMQRPDTLRPDGTMEYEIKAGDRVPDLFKR